MKLTDFKLLQENLTYLIRDRLLSPFVELFFDHKFARH